MATVVIDARGLKCPQPTFKMVAAINKGEAKPGDVLEVVADCDTFERDVRSFCSSMKRVLLSMRDEPGGAKRCTIQV